MTTTTFTQRRELRLAADALARARVKYSQEFQRAKLAAVASFEPITDGMAHQIAIEATGDVITKLEAELEIARREM